MATFNFDDTLTRLNGKPLSRQFSGVPFEGSEENLADVEKWKNAAVSVAEIVIHFILNVVPIETNEKTGRIGPKQLSDKEKFERFKLAEKIYDRGEDGLVEITEDERQLIKRSANTAGQSELMGLVWRWLEKPTETHVLKEAK